MGLLSDWLDGTKKFIEPFDEMRRRFYKFNSHTFIP